MTLQARERMMWLRRWRRGESSVLLATAMLALFVLASSSSANLAAAPFASTSLTASSLSASSLVPSATVSDAALSEAVLQWLESSLAASGSHSSFDTGFTTGIATPGSVDEARANLSLRLTPYHVAHALPPQASAPPRRLSNPVAACSLPLHEAASRSGIRTNSFPQ